MSDQPSFGKQPEPGQPQYDYTAQESAQDVQPPAINLNKTGQEGSHAGAPQQPAQQSYSAPDPYSLPVYGAPASGQQQFAQNQYAQPGMAQANNYGGTNYPAPQFQAPTQYVGGPGYIDSTSGPRGMSLTSMIIGLVSLFLAGWIIIPQIVGIILGHIGLSKESPQGRPFSITGLITNYLALVIYGGLYIFFFVILGIAVNESNNYSGYDLFSAR